MLLHYAERFAGCLHVDDEIARKSLIEHLRKAIANPSTAALMTNPLLVTVMAMIVIHHGDDVEAEGRLDDIAESRQI